MTPVSTSSLAAASTTRPTDAMQAKAAARRAECCDHEAKAPSRSDDAERSEGPRRSPLLKALVQALREVLATPTATPGTAETAAAGDGATASGAAKGASGAVSTADAKAARAAAARSAAKATDAAGAADAVKTDTPATEAADEVTKTSTATGGDALEQALTAFARALMQALRGGDDGKPGRGHGHGHGHHFGRREGLGWGDDPAQRLDKLAGLVAQAALGTAPVKPAPAATSPAATPSTTPTAASAPAAAAEVPASTTTTAAATATTATDAAEAAAAPAPAPATLVLEIRILPGVSSASPWARAADELVSAFGSLQQALGRSTGAEGSEGSVRDQLATFLRNLAARVRGDEAAMSDVEPTRPGALLSVTA
jgi:hypothetical protein